LPACDLILEAATEKFELKRDLFRELDRQAAEPTILATNTSALSVSALAAATQRPGAVVGLHFFNPVGRMQLVEVVVGQRTKPEVVQRAIKFTQQIGKLPVVANDRPGFIVNRILIPYLTEAAALWEQGARLADLEEAMLDFGMPMGPLRLIDEIGLDVTMHIAQTLRASFGERVSVPAALVAMVEAGLLGRKAGAGFFLHGKRAESNPAAASHVRSREAAAFPREFLQQRLVLGMVNESARCLADGVVNDPADIDFAMVCGTGFAPFRGGPLRHADSMGVGKLVETMRRHAESGAAQLAPCALLVEMAGSGRTFYAKD
jgi:3-hydroxyacyl-CoA dehydrogenase/enoyl-CoA hydratase/3-hydroxybutyryl-CoA epimerase